MTRTETKGERKRMKTTKQNTSNCSNLVEEVTPQTLSLGTKPFVIVTDALFKGTQIILSLLLSNVRI